MPALRPGALPPPESLVVVGVPYDGASFGEQGAANGPDILRKHSRHVWVCRHSADSGATRPDYSPRAGALVLDGASLLDAGNLLPEPSHSPEEVALGLSSCLDCWLRNGALPLVLGGDHSISFGAAHALSQLHPTGILFFDAHLDASPVSHVPLTHASWATLSRNLPQVHCVAQVGLRTLQPVPNGFQVSQDSHSPFASWGVDYLLAGPQTSLAQFDQWLSQLPKGLRWHLSVDADVLDPLLMPHTGMPLPLGLSPTHLLDLLLAVLNRVPVSSMDLVEFAPKDHSAYLSALTLAGILAETIPYLTGAAL